MEVLTYKKLDSNARRCAYQNPTLDPDFKRLLRLYDEDNLPVQPEILNAADVIDYPVDNNNPEDEELAVKYEPERKGGNSLIQPEKVRLLRTRPRALPRAVQGTAKPGQNIARAMSILSTIMESAKYPDDVYEDDPFLVKLLQNINNIDLGAVYKQATERPKVVRDQYFNISFNNRLFKLPFLHQLVLHHCMHQDQTKQVVKITSALFGRSIRRTKGDPDNRLVNKVTRWELEPGVYSEVSALHVAAFYGDLPMVKCLVRVGADVDLPTQRGNTPLILATTAPSHERFKIIGYLIDQGADANLCNEDGATPLHKAITQGADTTLLELLTTKGEANVNAVKWRGLATPLIQATSFRNFSAIDILLTKTDLTYTTPKKQTIFHYAVAANMPELVKKLIKTNSEELHNRSDLAGDTPFMLAVAEGNLEIMEILLEHGARLDHINVLGKSVWDFAFAAQDREDILDLLIRVHKGRVEYESVMPLATPVVSLSPLHVATRLDDVKLLKKLLDKGLDPRESDKKSMNSFFHIAAAENKHDVLSEEYENYDQLLEGRNRNEDTPLHMAARYGSAESMVVVMNMATDTLIDDFLHIKNFQHCTPLYLAVLRSTKNVALAIADKMDVIKDTGEDLAIAEDTDLLGNSYLHVAAKNNFPELCERLLSLNVSLDQRNDRGNTPLHEAALAGSTETVKCLLSKYLYVAPEVIKDKHQTAVDLHMKNFKDRTVLHMAAKCPTTTEEMLKILVSAISRVHLSDSILNNTDYQGNTAIHIAIKKQRQNLYGVLKALASGNFSIVNNEGDTPLHTAAKDKDPTVLATVLRVMDEENINKPLNVGNADGKTPLMLCVESGLESLLGKMIKDGSDLTYRSTFNGDTVLHDLVRLSVAHLECIDQWRSMYTTICNHSVKWWCLTNEIEEPDHHSKNFNPFKELAVKFLTSAVRNGPSAQPNTRPFYQLSRAFKNEIIDPLSIEKDEKDDGLTVIQLAVDLGASQIFETILNTPNVFRTSVKIEKSIVPRFDVTYITPDTSKFQADHKRHTVLSCLEILWNVADDSKVVEFLDITPVKQLSHNYWERYQWIYVVLMVVHIVYMSLFCKFALDLQLIPSQNTLGTNDANQSGIMFNSSPIETGNHLQVAPSMSDMAPFGLLLIWPTVVVLYLIVHNVFRILKWTRTDNSLTSAGKKPNIKLELTISFIWSILQEVMFLGSELINIFGFIFAVSVIVWFIFMALGSILQVYFLVLAFCVGWVFTLAFTKGFETVRSFTVMLKYIIAIDILRFLMIFSFIFIGFSLALHAIFLHAISTAAEFSSVWITFFYVFRVMLSVDDPFSETFEQDLEAVGISSSVPKVIYVIFMVISAIVLLNLLIAMMSDTYSFVKAKETEQWRVSNMKLAIGFEKQLRRLKHYIRFPVKKSFDITKEKTELRAKSLYGSEYKISSERYYAYFYSGVNLIADGLKKQNEASSSIQSLKEHFGEELSSLTKTVQNLEAAFDKLNKKLSS